MPNSTHEQNLINSFVAFIQSRVSPLNVVEIINFNCKSKTYADVEFSTLNEHWVIEAKSNRSADSHNSAHKLFGELLKETGRNRIVESELELKYGILIPDPEFYRNKFRQINRAKYIGFGELIPVDSIFYLEGDTFQKVKWSEFF